MPATNRERGTKLSSTRRRSTGTVLVVTARLLAAAAPHSGDWLYTLPVSACGLHLEDNAVRVAVDLRLGCVGTGLTHVHVVIVVPWWILSVNVRYHAKNAGRVQRHALLNDLIYR